MMRYDAMMVPLSAVDLCDQTFRITTDQNVDSLRKSIKLLGLLHPPFLMKRGERFTVISGFRRIQACFQLGWQALSAGVVPPEAENLACIQIAIADNALQRRLNLMEVSRALNLLAQSIPEPEKLAYTASSLTLPDNPAIIRKIQTLCLLPPVVQELIVADVLSLSMALALEKIPRDACIAFAEMFQALQPSLGKQRELFTMVNEIALREEKDCLVVLGEAGIRGILIDENLNKAEKTAKIRSYLKQRRFPTLAAAKIKFDEFRKKLPTGDHFKLMPPPDFEGTEHVIRLHFNGLDELKSHGSVLADLMGDEQFMAYWSGM